MSEDNEFHEKIIAFLKYRKEHEKFYSLAYEMSHELETNADSLKALAIRWVETRIACAENNNQAIKCKTGCNLAFVRGDGAPFIEAEELDELAHLKGGLKVLSGGFAGMRPWLTDVRKNSQNILPLPKDPILTQIWIQQFVILNNEHEILHKMLFTAKVLERASGLLDGTDFSPNVVRDDFFGLRVMPKLLLVASALTGGAAGFARSAAGLVRQNEFHWQEYKQQVAQLTSGVKLIA